MELSRSLVLQLGFSSLLPMVAIAVSIVVSGRERRSSRVLLGGILLVVSVLTAVSFSLANAPYVRAVPRPYVANLVGGALGPLLYQYLRSCLEPRFTYRVVDALAYLPVVVPMLLLAWALRALHPWEFSRWWILSHKAAETAWLLGWWVAAAVAVRRAGVPLRAFWLDFRSLRLTWLRFLYVALAAIWLQRAYNFVQYAYRNDFAGYLASVTAYFVLVGFFSSVVLYVVANRADFLAPDRGGPRMDPDEEARSFAAIESAIVGRQLYLDPELGLERLSDAVRMPPRRLSSLVNARTGMNLNQYLNRFRVEHACRLLRDEARGDKILAVAFDSGFRNKSTFNAAFKAAPGTPPMEYRRRALAENGS